MGKGSNSTTTVNQPPPQVMAAYEKALAGAQAAASAPYQQYNGALQAPFSPAQMQGFDAVQNAQGAAVPYINTASQYLDQSTAPLMNGVQQFSPQAIQQYQSPYTQQVVDATQAQFNNQNAQAANRLTGQAASAGALGGDRAGVAQAALAGQQQLAQAPVIAGLNQSGYNTALNEFNRQQQLQLGANQAQAGLAQNAASGFSSLGNQALGSQLTGANALLGVGQTQQQQAQTALNIPYQQFLAQQAYPFQTSQFFTNAAEGLGSGMGGTSTATGPQPSMLSQGLGLATGLIGLAGLFNRGGTVKGYDSGGGVGTPANITMQASSHQGGIAIPMLHAGQSGTPSGQPAGASSSLADYLSAVKSSAIVAPTAIHNSTIKDAFDAADKKAAEAPAQMFGVSGGEDNGGPQYGGIGGPEIVGGGAFGGGMGAGGYGGMGVGAGDITGGMDMSGGFGDGFGGDITGGGFAQGGSIPYQNSPLALGVGVPDLNVSVVPDSSPMRRVAPNIPTAQLPKTDDDGGFGKAVDAFNGAIDKNKAALKNLFSPPQTADALAIARENSPEALANPNLYGPGFARGGGLRGFADGGVPDDTQYIPDPNTGGLTALPPAPTPPRDMMPQWAGGTRVEPPGSHAEPPAPTPDATPPVTPAVDPDQTAAAHDLARSIENTAPARTPLAGDALGAPITAPRSAPSMGAPVEVREMPAHPAVPMPQVAPGVPAQATPTPSVAAASPQKRGFDINAAMNSPWMALAQAGFATAAGRSPYPMQNIGAGANAGLQYLVNTPARSLAQTQARAAAENLAATELIRQQSGFAAGTPPSARVPGGINGMATAGGTAPGVAGSAPPMTGTVVSAATGQPLFDIGQQWNRANMLIASGVPDYVKAGQGLMTNLTAMIKEGVVPSRDGGVTPISGAAEAAARKAAMIATATAPIEITKSLVSQAGRPQVVTGGQTVTSGFNTLPPQLQALVNRQIQGGASGNVAAPSGYVQNVNAVESGGDPNARNPQPGQTSSGLGGFTDGTWLATFKTAFPDVAAKLTDQQILAYKTNPDVSNAMTAALAQHNAPLLQEQGLPVTPASLYLAHHFGVQGASAIAHADRDTPIDKVLPPNVVAVNPDIQGKTAGQVVDGIVTRFGTGSGTQQIPPAAQPPAQSSFVPTASPVVGMSTPTVAPPDLAPSPSMSAPHLLRNADGSLTATNTPGFTALQTAIAKTVGETPDTLDKLAQSRAQLVTMQEEIAKNKDAPAFLQTGFAGDARTQFANAANTLSSTLGLRPMFEPSQLANNQAFLKNSNVAAFTLARQMSGGRVAVGEVLQANRSVPNQENSPYGNVVVSNLLLTENLRQTDRAAYVYEQATRGVDPVRAARVFDKTNPPESYVSTALAHSVETFYPQAVQKLRSVKPTPAVIAAFDKYWGAGTAQRLLASKP